MGTSISQRSPKSTNWRIVDLAYSRGEISTERLSTELLRAATNQDSGNLFQDLASPIIAECLRIVVEHTDQNKALQLVQRNFALSGAATLAASIAQRAAIHALISDTERTSSFVSSLFREASNYLVSRDVSGFIGTGRFANVSDVISLKDDIKRIITSKVKEVPYPKGDLRRSTNWRKYVNSVVKHIKGGET